jgi:hypothetical protein
MPLGRSLPYRLLFNHYGLKLNPYVLQTLPAPVQPLRTQAQPLRCKPCPTFTAEWTEGGLPPISALQIQLLGMNVELGDIEKKVNVSARPDWSNISKTELDKYIDQTTHCSALVRATPVQYSSS